MKKTFALPNMEQRFTIQVKGEESGVIYNGDFLYRRPSLGERGLISVMRSRLNGDLSTIDPDISYFHEATSHLRYTLKEFPDWWRDSNFGLNLYDGNVILEIYVKVVEFEAEWRKKVHGDNPILVQDGGVENESAIQAPKSASGASELRQ